ncbi:MAG: hypothetical protein WDM78_05450 [Puia sp.]
MCNRKNWIIKNLNEEVDFLKGQMCSTENLVVGIWNQLKDHLPDTVKLQLDQIV